MRTPASSLTGISLLANQLWCRNKLWYRNRVKIKQLPTISRSPDPCPSHTTVSETPTARPPQTIRLPQELVEMVISYLVYDTPTLLACSMTCRSWYLAAVPHLHHSLTTSEHFCPREGGSPRHKPLQNSYELGLLPLVKRFRIRCGYRPYTPLTLVAPFTLDDRTLRYFSALVNLQELVMYDLQISNVLTNVQQSFGCFAQTLRSLALEDPRGSCRQIFYFVGLFPNLQDLKLYYSSSTKQQESTDEPELVPLSVPRLNGRLTLRNVTSGKFVEEMIALFGGLRFRHMDLSRVKCAWLLLGACAGTLETLRLYPTNPRENGVTARSHFDLSRHKSLRTVEITARSMVSADADPNFLRNVLSTITSPPPLNVVIIYQHHDIGYIVWCPPEPAFFVGPSLGWWGEYAWHHQRRFKELRDMHMARAFRLVLRVDDHDCNTEAVVRELECAVSMERERGGFDYLPCEPLIVSAVR